ncbi:hypothetical protein PGQ11_011247 [Apiospora arundinis]|uniref:C2H2-type domain-containing protein n=1 Tax=Apiospora arundinis TaxID=335852 RepID=A0ABR2I035_9PEZI
MADHGGPGSNVLQELDTSPFMGASPPDTAKYNHCGCCNKTFDRPSLLIRHNKTRTHARIHEAAMQAAATAQTVSPLVHTQDVMQPLDSHASGSTSHPPFPKPISTQSSSHISEPKSVVTAVEELLKAHTQSLHDKKQKAEAESKRLTVEVGKERECVRRSEAEKNEAVKLAENLKQQMVAMEERVRQFDEERTTLVAAMEVSREMEQGRLEIQRELAKEQERAQELVLEKEAAEEQIRGLTERVEGLEQEVWRQSEEVNKARHLEKEAVGRAEAAEKEKASADEKTLTAVGWAKECCDSAKAAEAQRAEETQRAETAERELEKALQKQKDQEDEIGRLKPGKAGQDGEVVEDHITVSEDATSAPYQLRSKRKRTLSRAARGTAQRMRRSVGASHEEATSRGSKAKRIGSLPDQLKQLSEDWEEWEEDEEFRVIRFDLQVSRGAEGDDALPGSYFIKCARYREESVISNIEIAVVLEHLYRKIFDQKELYIIGRVLKRHTFGTITASEYDALFDAEVEGTILLVLWRNFHEIITEVVSGIRTISE